VYNTQGGTNVEITEASDFEYYSYEVLHNISNLFSEKYCWNICDYVVKDVE